MLSHAAIIAALVIGLACSCVSAGTQAFVDEQIERLAPELKMVFSQQKAGGSGELGIRRFDYTSRQSAWPYGEGFAVWSRKSSTVLWLYLHHGDFPPHEVYWADFDGDGREDLFFHAGFEDVFTTHLYLNRIASDTYGVSQFAEGYSNDEVYATVVDVDGNGRPELLVPDRYFDDDDPCAPELHELEANKPEVQEEYRRLANGFRHFNFDGDLFLFHSVQVISVGAAPDPAKTTSHLRWRIRILEQAMPQISEPCRAGVRSVISHLEREADAAGYTATRR